MIDSQRLADIFSILSVDTRVRMIDLLKRRPLCVNALARELGITPAAVSQHLRILRQAGLVTGEKRGYFVHYHIRAEVLDEWRGLAQGLLDPRNEEEASRGRWNDR